MFSKRKFTGVPFVPKLKCKECENLEQCSIGDNSLTIKAMILECESFYYLFKKLEEFEKHPILVGNMKKDKEAVDDYMKRHENIPSLLSPLVVNGALAVELALKFLIFEKTESCECTHNLKCLFEQLPGCHKIALKDKIYKQAHQNEETLNSNLSSISNLFVDFRYSFENSHIGFSNFFNDFVHIVCDYAILQKSNYFAVD